MARVKGIRLVSKAEAAREFGVEWYQVDHLVRTYHPRPIPVFDGDRRTKLKYRYAEIKRLMTVAPLKRAS